MDTTSPTQLAFYSLFCLHLMGNTTKDCELKLAEEEKVLIFQTKHCTLKIPVKWINPPATPFLVSTQLL